MNDDNERRNVLAREDVYCPACDDPMTAFRIEDVGVKTATEYVNGVGIRITASRPAWEAVMLDHLRSRLDDPEHRRIYDLCMTGLMAIGTTAEAVARDTVQIVADSTRRLMERSLRENQRRAGRPGV